MELYIKGMKNGPDLAKAEALLRGYGLHPVSIAQEKASLTERALTTKQFSALQQLLLSNGYHLMPEAEGRMVLEIKAIIVEQVHFSCREKPLDINFTAYLSYKLGKAYTQISHIFSTIEGITIKQFIIQQKTERVKQLLREDMPLAKLAMRMSYSSVQHLSSQFKKVTGVTPVQYREQHTIGVSACPKDLFLQAHEA